MTRPFPFVGSLWSALIQIDLYQSWLQGPDGLASGNLSWMAMVSLHYQVHFVVSPLVSFSFLYHLAHSVLCFVNSSILSNSLVPTFYFTSMTLISPSQ